MERRREGARAGEGAAAESRAKNRSDGGAAHTFLRTATSVQSKAEKRPPQTAKEPPSRGASKRIACAREPRLSAHAAARRRDPRQRRAPRRGGEALGGGAP